MRKLKLVLEYDGTRYCGFGVQPGLPTVQAQVESALSRILGHEVRVSAGGRTDGGVHARGQVVSFATFCARETTTLLRALNATLPGDMAVAAVEDAEGNFDARRDARRRRYRYTIWHHPVPNVWWQRYCLHVRGPLNVTAMRKAARDLVGTHDFAAFAMHLSRDSRPGRSTVRTVSEARWRREGNFLHFDIAANGFLRHMVRAIVGSLLRVGRGELSEEQFVTAIDEGVRQNAGPVVPARGLTLIGVDY